MLAVNEELENQIREIRHDHSGRLHLGISVTRAMQVMPLVLPFFTAKYPHVKLELTESGSGTLEELLQTGQIDLALAALESTSMGFSYELIEKETMGILAGKDSHIARTHPAGTPVSLETNSLEVGRRVTVETGACMILPNIYVDDYVQQRKGQFFPLEDYENHRHFYACCRKNEFIPQYTKDFIQITTRVLALQQGCDMEYLR